MQQVELTVPQERCQLLRFQGPLLQPTPQRLLPDQELLLLLHREQRLLLHQELQLSHLWLPPPPRPPRQQPHRQPAPGFYLQMLSTRPQSSCRPSPHSPTLQERSSPLYDESDKLLQLRQRLHQRP